MKKFILSVVLAALCALATPCASTDQTEQKFRSTVAKATVAFYEGKQVCGWKESEGLFGPNKRWSCEFKSVFLCSATIIQKDGQGNYVGLTVGHCIEWKNEDNYFIAEDVGDKPVLKHVEIIKAEFDSRYDYAIFKFSSQREYPTVSLNKMEEGLPPIGTRIINVNFSLGLGKEVLEGKVVSAELHNKDSESRYLVSIGLAQGASGSAIVSESSHQIVGLVEFVFPGTQMSAGVIPTGKHLMDFIEDDSAGLKPVAAKALPVSSVVHVPTTRELLIELWQRLLKKLRLR